MRLILRLKGGLGNQFFIVSQGIIHEFLYGVTPKYDLNLYSKKLNSKYSYTKRSIEIHNFLNKELMGWNPLNIKIQVPTSINIMLASAMGYNISTNEDIELKTLKGKIYADRYFQSTSNIFEHRNLLLQSFLLKDSLIKSDSGIFFKSIINSKSNCVCIHVRRGDYLTQKNLKQFNSLNTDYFNGALNLLKGLGINLTPIIFSDDINFCKREFSNLNPIFIEGTNTVEDFYLMTLCDYHIISNSTFSWWAAFLSKSSKKVIAPKIWFHPNIEKKIAIPENWITL